MWCDSLLSQLTYNADFCSAFYNHHGCPRPAPACAAARPPARITYRSTCVHSALPTPDSDDRPAPRMHHSPHRRPGDGGMLSNLGGFVIRMYVSYIVRRSTTGRPSDETLWLPNKEMTKPCEVSDETSTNLFPHFQCQTLQCDTSTLNPRPGGSGPVA